MEGGKRRKSKRKEEGLGSIVYRVAFQKGGITSTKYG